MVILSGVCERHLEQNITQLTSLLGVFSTLPVLTVPEKVYLFIHEKDLEDSEKAISDSY